MDADLLCSGFHHSRDLGENLRKDLLLMNSQVLNDVRVFSSSENRVTSTATTLCESLLDVTALPDDFVQIQRRMLDDSSTAKELMDNVKGKLQLMLKSSSLKVNLDSCDGCGGTDDAKSELVSKLLDDIKDTLAKFQSAMKHNLQNPSFMENMLKSQWCCSENAMLFLKRWQRFFLDFCEVRS